MSHVSGCETLSLHLGIKGLIYDVNDVHIPGVIQAGVMCLALRHSPFILETWFVHSRES